MPHVFKSLTTRMSYRLGIFERNAQNTAVRAECSARAIRECLGDMSETDGRKRADVAGKRNAYASSFLPGNAVDSQGRGSSGV